MKIYDKLYIKTEILLIINTLNEVGRLQFRITVHSAASPYSLNVGDPKFSEICHCLYEGSRTDRYEKS